jgi:hypothetical protein
MSIYNGRVKDTHKVINRISIYKYRSLVSFEKCFMKCFKWLVVGFHWITTNAQFCSRNFRLAQARTSSRREFYDWSLAESPLLSRSTPWFSRKKNGSSDTGSFDWNGWNSISTEFRVIPSEHCRVYVSNDEKGAILSISVIFSKWCGIRVVSIRYY